MTYKEIVKRVREDTLLKEEEIDNIVEPLHEGEHYPWNPEEHKAVAQAQQDKILSRKNIAIIDPDALIPLNPYSDAVQWAIKLPLLSDVDRGIRELAYALAQQDMLNEGWKKVIK